MLNPLYRDLLTHYGTVALPCRVRDPDRKGKVESAIHHTQTALRGQRFKTLEAAQAWPDRWDERWADTRIHGTMKRQVAAMFADERPRLRPLPIEPFRFYAFGEFMTDAARNIFVVMGEQDVTPRSRARRTRGGHDFPLSR